jgi:hypothetical protein
LKLNNLGAPKLITAPEIAYRRPDAYHSGADFTPRKDDLPYREYKFLGRLPPVDDARIARSQAKAKYGPRANVFRTARHWVVYEVR